MNFMKKWSRSRNPNNMIIILALVIVVSIGVIALVITSVNRPKQEVVLEEGKDYDINHTGRAYVIVDDEGNAIELERVSSEIFEDRYGRRYKFVSGSPFKYMGEDKE
jgi:hypothetical protein